MTDLWVPIPWIVGTAVVFAFVIAPFVVTALLQHRDHRTVHCPKSKAAATVQVDASHAARTSFPGPAEVRVETCSKWPELEGCDQECLRVAEGDAPE